MWIENLHVYLDIINKRLTLYFNYNSTFYRKLPKLYICKHIYGKPVRNGNCFLLIAFWKMLFTICFLLIAFYYLLFASCFLLISFWKLLISFAHRNVEMRSYFFIGNNVNFEEIPYIDLRQTYMQMIGFTKKISKLSISNKQKAISK